MSFREGYNGILGVAGAVLAIISIVIGLDKIPADWYNCLGINREGWGNFLVGFWVIVPPVFFWIDWWLSKDIDDDRKLDKIKHNHDLARNIWLGLTALLVVLFGIEWPL